MRTMKALIAILLIALFTSAHAASGARVSTTPDGLQHWIGLSTDTKPTGTSIPVGSDFIETDTKQMYRVDKSGTWVSLGNIVYLANLLTCEDTSNSVCKVEQQFSYCANKSADSACGNAGTRFVHAISCAGADAAATAGDVALRDAIAAGAGTVVLDIAFAAAFQQPFTLIVDATFSTGIYLDFTTTADVNCTVSYR